MFAKLFGTDNDQVLVKLDVAAASGAPEVRVFCQMPSGNLFSVAAVYENSERGHKLATRAFETLDEAGARRGLAAALRESAVAN